MKPALRHTLILLCAFGLVVPGTLASGTGRSLAQLSGTTNPLVEQASSLVGQVAATTDSPESSQWNAYSARGPAVASAANLANKLEAVVASGLPSAISETYGQPGNPLTADKILEFLQGAVAENALVGSKYRLAPSAGLPATTLSAAAEQVAAILVAKSVDRGLYYRTIPRSDPNFASGQLQDVYTEVTEDVAEGLDEASDSSPSSNVPTGQLVQSLVRTGLAQPSFAGANAVESRETEQVLETKAIQFGLQQRAVPSTNPPPTTG